MNYSVIAQGPDQRLLETNHHLIQGTAPESSKSMPTQESARKLHVCNCATSLADCMLQRQSGAPFREAGHGEVEQLCVNKGIVSVGRCLKSWRLQHGSWNTSRVSESPAHGYQYREAGKRSWAVLEGVHQLILSGAGQLMSREQPISLAV